MAICRRIHKSRLALEVLGLFYGHVCLLSGSSFLVERPWLRPRDARIEFDGVMRRKVSCLVRRDTRELEDSRVVSVPIIRPHIDLTFASTYLPL